MSAQDGRRLCLILPGLFGPAPPAGVDRRAALNELTAGLDLRAAERLLSRARSGRANPPGTSPEDLLFSAFGHARSADVDWPAAAVSGHADLGGDTGFWLRADPVHLKPDAGNLVLFDGEQFTLDPDEADALAQSINAHFADEGWRLETPHPLRWYLELQEPARIRTHPLSMARFKSVDDHLPSGDDAPRWHRLLNEIQMVLHGCDTNRLREARGEPAVNSVWFWGGGTLPRAQPVAWTHAHGDSAVLRGLSALAGIPGRALPGDAQDWLRQSDDGAHLVFMDDGHAPARVSDLEGWRGFIDGLNRRWFTPIVEALDGGQLSTVSVLTEGNVRYDAGPGRWWA